MCKQSAAYWRNLYEITERERNALADAVEAVRHLEPSVTMPEYAYQWDGKEGFFEGTIHAAQIFREAIIDAIKAALNKPPDK